MARLDWQQCCCLTAQQLPLDGGQLFVLGFGDLEQTKYTIFVDLARTAYLHHHQLRCFAWSIGLGRGLIQ